MTDLLIKNDYPKGIIDKTTRKSKSSTINKNCEIINLLQQLRFHTYKGSLNKFVK